MKFRIHLFRELRETFEVEADNADAALEFVDANLHELDPVETELQDYLPQSGIDPLFPDGSVNYSKSEWRD